MARVVSVSRRTDIPAFYSRWFLSRVRAGFCHWRNPYGGQVYRVSLAPEDVLAFIFWSRNPWPLLPHLEGLRAAGYRFAQHMTINGYPRAIESHNPPVDAAIATFRAVSQVVGPNFTFWRYDPILLSDQTPAAYHLEQFDRISRALAGATHRCYFSFAQFYGKTERNIARVERDHGLTVERTPAQEEQRALILALRDIAAPRGITLYACCEADLVGDGIAPSRCIDSDIIQALRGDAALHLAKAPTRADCGCVEAADIGAYDTCAFGCAYCYATNSRAAGLRRLRTHDPEDTILWRPDALRGDDLATREVPLGGSGRQPVQRDADIAIETVTLPGKLL